VSLLDLSIQNQMAEKRKVLSSNGKKWDVSFRPAIVDKKLYPRWSGLNSEYIKRFDDIAKIQLKLNSKQPLTEDDDNILKEFKKLTDEIGEAAVDLLVYVFRANGYEDFSEDDLLENFSLIGISEAIQYIMDLNQENKDKKKANKKA
jgi:predicted peroxiredoxin